MIIPSIDIIKGKLVQLKQGQENKKEIEINSPKKYAKIFSKLFEIQVIDLDAAFGRKDNIKLIKELCKIADCRVGGGIRTIEKAQELIKSGAKKVIIGTEANPVFLSRLAEKIGKEKIIVALDSKYGKVAIRGWKKQLDKSPIQRAKELESYCSEFLYTCIEKEGLLNGADYKTICLLRNTTKNKITVAGGIASIKEIKMFEKIDIDCIVGMAIYTGKINPEECFIQLLDFNKMELIPTIAKDEQGNILMLAYSTKESLKKTILTGKACYFSRERKRLWAKGETSGNFQEIIKIRTDCDKDALLFIVKQKNNACHLNKYSCFDELKKFDFQELYKVIQERISNGGENSYTKKLASNPNELKRKLVEEAAEVITSNSKENLIWECADLIYFLLVIMARENITLDEIYKENQRRNKK